MVDMTKSVQFLEKQERPATGGLRAHASQPLTALRTAHLTINWMPKIFWMGRPHSPAKPSSAYRR
jgi:hypothetical protein